MQNIAGDSVVSSNHFFFCSYFLSEEISMDVGIISRVHSEMGNILTKKSRTAQVTMATGLRISTK